MAFFVIIVIHNTTQVIIQMLLVFFLYRYFKLYYVDSTHWVWAFLSLLALVLELITLVHLLLLPKLLESRGFLLGSRRVVWELGRNNLKLGLFALFITRFFNQFGIHELFALLAVLIYILAGRRLNSGFGFGSCCLFYQDFQPSNSHLFLSIHSLINNLRLS